MGRGGGRGADGGAVSPQRIVGYGGFLPGQQHMHGETYGANAETTLRERATANNNKQYLTKSDLRPALKADITNAEGQGHIPGYAGHIPGLDAGTEQTFGNSTAKGLQQLASTVKSFAGNATAMSFNEIPRERGIAGDRSPRARTAPARVEPKVPGYRGYIPGGQHVYARTFGMTTSELGSAHETNKQDKNSFISFSDPRPGNKDKITVSPGRNHVPGYAGHIPGLDMGSTCTFGQSTTQNLLDSASKITPSGSKAMQIKHMSTKDVPRERGAARPQSIEPPAPSAQVGSPGYATEGRLPGYTGFQAGGQHVFADTQGRATKHLREAHAKNRSDKNQFVNYNESRPSERGNLTNTSSTRDAVTDQNTNSHLPGYAGHCPTTREAIGQRFGVATSDSLYDKSKKSKWYSGETKGVAKKDIPVQMGRPRETVAQPKPSRDNQLPGYTGFVQHSKDTFAKTYGETTRQLKNPPPHNLLVSNVGKPFGEWVLAGNNDGTNHQPGYAGHIPGLRDRPVGSTFGHSTSPGIFNESDRASSMKIERIPKSSYHSGLRMSDKAKAKITSVKSGAKHWNKEHTTTSHVFQRGMFMP